MRKLGTRQRSVLSAMKRHSGRWYPACGWYWGTVSETIRVCESLVKAGYARRVQFEVDEGYEVL